MSGFFLWVVFPTLKHSWVQKKLGLGLPEISLIGDGTRGLRTRLHIHTDTKSSLFAMSLRRFHPSKEMNTACMSVRPKVRLHTYVLVCVRETSARAPSPPDMTVVRHPRTGVERCSDDILSHVFSWLGHGTWSVP